jgi:hypothetical protein
MVLRTTTNQERSDRWTLKMEGLLLVSKEQATIPLPEKKEERTYSGNDALRQKVREAFAETASRLRSSTDCREFRS